jgi:hypothetical protein
MTNKLITVGNQSIATKNSQTASFLGRGLNTLKSKTNVTSTTDLEVIYRKAREDYNTVMSFTAMRFSLFAYFEINDVALEEFKLDLIEQELQPYFLNLTTLTNLVKVFQELANKGFGKAYFPLATLEELALTTTSLHEEDLHYYKLAFEWCFDNKTIIDTEIWFDLGLMYHYQLLDESLYNEQKIENNEQATYWFQKVASYDNQLEGQYYLGETYRSRYNLFPNNGAEDLKLADFWCRKAAEKGCLLAQHTLGWSYFIGEGVEKDSELAFYWMYKAKAAEQNNTESQIHIGFMYLNGEGIEQNDTRAAEWLLKAAQLGCWEAQYHMQWFYDVGKGVKQDLEMARFWGCMSGLNDPNDFFDQATFYYSKPDYIGSERLKIHEHYNMLAAYFYRKAAELNHLSAQYNLGQLYYQGSGVVQNYEEAVFWYRKAAEQNQPDAQFALGCTCLKGIGIAKNYEEAAYWYRKAIDQNHHRAQTYLGTMYMDSLWAEHDDELAFLWFQESAKQGESYAQFNLGLIYSNGRGVEPDDKIAALWFQKAADQGNPDAQFALGKIYAIGESVEQNLETALSWIRKAAEQNVLDAQYICGEMYSKGLGVWQNDDEDVFWYCIAAAQGHILSQELLTMRNINWNEPQCYLKNKGLLDLNVNNQKLNIRFLLKN